MAGHISRDFTIDWDSVELANVQSKSFNVNNEYADVTTDDDDGWITLLADPATRGVEVSVSGIAESEAVLADIMAASVAAATLDANLPSSLAVPGSLSGSFLITSFSYDGSGSGEAVTFSATFRSTGEVTYTPSAAA